MRLVRAAISDCEKLWCLQTEAFADLLAKYQDFETSPANEPKESIRSKLMDEFTFFYFIYLEEDIVGAVRVVDRKNGDRKRIAPIFIMKKYRDKGLAQKTFKEIEKLHGSNNWMLDTILQEEGNCHLYEKMGYKRTGKIENINEKMDIVYYEKD
jgi:predicted acetyltransferase